MIINIVFGLFLLGFAIYQTRYLKTAKEKGEIETGIPRKMYKRSENAELFEQKYRRAFKAQIVFYIIGALVIVIPLMVLLWWQGNYFVID